MHMYDKSRKPRVHFSLDVLWEAEETEPAILVPGQAFAVSTFQDRTILKDPNPVKGKVTIKVFCSLHRGDAVYTDASGQPIDMQDLVRDEMLDYTNIHISKKGFGVTVLSPEDQVPGSFSNCGRLVLPYTLRELYEREQNSRKVMGPACHMYMVPSIFVKLTSKASPLKGDVELLDVELGETAMFRKIPLPVVLGDFETFHKPAAWQSLLLQQHNSPTRCQKLYLRTLLGSLTDPVTGASNIYESGRYYFALPGKTPSEIVPLSERGRIMIADIPYKRYDVLHDMDLGRKRVFSWEKQLMYQHRS